MTQKRIYNTPEVTIEYFLTKEYMMTPTLSNAEDPIGLAPKRREPAF